MTFGFDPSLILSATKTQEPTPNETLRTLADLAGSRMQMRQGEASLADLSYRQGRERSLADIYRQASGDPSALPQALLREGFGPQAFAAQDQQSQLERQRAERTKLYGEMQAAERKQMGELFYGVKDQSGWDAAIQGAPEYYRGMLPAQFDPAVAERLANLAVPAEKRADLARQAEQLTETKRHNRAMEVKPSGMPALTILTGEGGAQYFVDPRNPGAAAAPVMGPDGKPIMKPQGGGDDPRELDAVGWERTPTAPKIKREEAAAFRDSNAAADDVLTSSAAYRKLIDEHGSELWGAAASDMDTYATDMLLQVKNLAKLGVLSKSDEDLINRLIPRATGKEGATTSKAVLLSKLDRFQTLIQQKLDTRAKALGYRKASAAPAASSLTAEEQAELADLEAKYGSSR